MVSGYLTSCCSTASLGFLTPKAWPDEPIPTKSRFSFSSPCAWAAEKTQLVLSLLLVPHSPQVSQRVQSEQGLQPEQKSCWKEPGAMGSEHSPRKRRSASLCSCTALSRRRGVIVWASLAYGCKPTLQEHCTDRGSSVGSPLPSPNVRVRWEQPALPTYRALHTMGDPMVAKPMLPAQTLASHLQSVT